MTETKNNQDKDLQQIKVAKDEGKDEEQKAGAAKTSTDKSNSNLAQT